ncbi:MAG: ABC transporter permease [Xanthomonadales bacterium]|nr:FtsX-like permease family protein [Gammaproteobacteria bacterium]NNK50317.1 ABC transporter permease [Xanthomonadales bacterium]
MMLNLRLAWRNLWRQKRRTWLTATAMIFSNVLLVFMISLQFGSYDMMINNTLQAFSGHFQAQRAGYNDNPKLRLSIDAIGALAQDLRLRMPDTKIAARAAAFALASSDQRSFGIQVIGVQPEFEPGVSTLPGLVTKGAFLDDPGAAEIVIGSVMARNLKVGVGDEITLLGSGRDGSFAAGILTVRGIFNSGLPDMDRSFAEIPLKYFQEMFSMGDHGNTIAFSVSALDQVTPELNQAAQALKDHEDLLLLDWTRLHPGLKQAIQADLSSAWFMYGVLIVLVAFSVLNTQLMAVLERTKEFGVITALGIKPRKLAGLIMLETAMMAFIGLVIGLFLGWLVAAYFNTVGFSYPGMDEVAAKFNLPGKMYPSVTPFSMLLGPVVVFLFCLLASIYPALRLFRLQPVDAMRAA